MNELGKFWFYNTFLVKLHGCSVRNFKSLTQYFLKWFWIIAFNVWAWLDNVDRRLSTKHQILTLQNQKVADEK